MAIVKATNHVECPPKERHLRSALICSCTPCFRVSRLRPNLVFFYWGRAELDRAYKWRGEALKGREGRACFWVRAVFNDG